LIGLIIAAGPTWCFDVVGFPPESKPKCLFHPGHKLRNWNTAFYKSDPSGGKNNSDLTLLERQVFLLRKNGIKRIRIVTGYRSQDIELFNREKGLGLDFLYNPKWETDAVNSIIVGVEDLDDDLLIVYGDGFVGEIDLNNILKCDTPTVALGLYQTMYKFGNQHIELLKRADEFRMDIPDLIGNCERFKRESRVKCPYDNTQGLRLVRTMMNIYGAALEKGEAVYLPVHDSTDVDFFKQTAESTGRYPCK